MPLRKQDRADDGRYTFDGKLDRICVCGHTLAHHAAAAPHECFVSTYSHSDPNRAECDCPKFRPSRRKSVTAGEQPTAKRGGGGQ
jgi:hypothetical protein